MGALVEDIFCDKDYSPVEVPLAGPGTRERGGASMSGAENEAVVRRLLEVAWNENRPEVADECLAADAVAHSMGDTGSTADAVPYDPAVQRRVIADWRTGFPDYRWVIHELFAAGDRIVVNMSFTGTHTGVFRLGPWTIPPTGRRLDAREVCIFRVEAGKIAEQWFAWDRLSVLEQLGVVPPWARADA
jgi:predicted ester cyclase